MERGLGRYQEFDERSRKFRAIVGVEDLPLQNKIWTVPVWNDQGQEGACVGFGWGHELAAQPAPYMTDYDFSMKIYHRAQQLDQWFGEDYEGTSVLAGAKAVRELTTPTGQPLIEGYSWAFGTEELCRSLAFKGPVVFGCDWYEGMWDTDENAYIHKTGGRVGGHCVCLNRVVLKKIDATKPLLWNNVNMETSFVRGRNSWSRDWGYYGNFRLSLVDLDALVKDGADACIPYGRHWL